MGSVWFPPERVFTANPAARLRNLYAMPVAYEPAGESTAQANLQEVAVFVTCDERHQRLNELLPLINEKWPVTEEHAVDMAERLFGGPIDRLRADLQQLGFFSVTKGNDSIPLAWPVPGASCSKAGNWRFQPFSPGLYCPLRDASGRLLGWEVRKDCDRNGRYAVFSSKQCPLQIPESGEQPIAWHFPREVIGHPTGGWGKIVLVEGKAVKPWVVARRFGLPVLGCGGSMSGASSPEQLLLAVKYLAPGGQLILFADAGWLLNVNVARAMAKTVSILRKNGCLPVIAAARSWHREKNKSSKKKRVGSDGCEYLGSDPDELEPLSFWDTFNHPKELEEWSGDSSTPDEVRTAIAEGLHWAELLQSKEEHIRRQGSADRRKTTTITPLLLESDTPATTFAADEMTPATIAGLERLQAKEEARFQAWKQEHWHHFETAIQTFDQQWRRAKKVIGHLEKRWVERDEKGDSVWEEVPERWMTTDDLKARNEHRKKLREGKDHHDDEFDFLAYAPPVHLKIRSLSAGQKRLATQLVRGLWRTYGVWCDVQCWREELRLDWSQEELLDALCWVQSLEHYLLACGRWGLWDQGSSPSDVAEIKDIRFDAARTRIPSYVAFPMVMHNRSGTGAGKTEQTTRDAKQIWGAAGDEFRGGMIYLNENYRSPAVEPLEGFFELPARHPGLIAVKAPDGKSRIIRASEKNSEPLVEEPNCQFAHRLAQVVERGHPGKVVNTFCTCSCPHRPEDWEEQVQRDGSFEMVNIGGDGSCSFMDKLLEVVEEVKRPMSHRKDWVQRIRCSTDGFMGLASYGSGFIGHSTVVIDETAQLASAVTQQVTLTQSDLVNIEMNLQEHFDGQDLTDAINLLVALRHLLNPKPQKQGKKWQKDFGDSPDAVRSDPKIQKALQAIVGRFSSQYGVQLAHQWMQPLDTGGQVCAALWSKDEDERRKKVDQVPMPVLPDILRALLPNLRTDQTGQTIYVSNCAATRQRVLVLTRTRSEFSEGISKAAATIVLDATERTEDILSRLDLHHAHTEAIEATPQANGIGHSAEVKLFQVPCLGGLGRYRKADKTKERDALVDAWVLDQQQRRGLCPGEVAVLDHKPFCRKGVAYEQPWLTLVARGGNYFEKCRAMLMVGLPIQNLISQAADYELMSATAIEAPEIGEWSEHRIAIEIIQGMGRLRTVRRSGSFEIWFVNDANFASLCDQKEWERPTVVEAREVIGHPAVVTAQATAIEKVESVIKEMKVACAPRPTSASYLCGRAGIPRNTFNRACKNKGTSVIELVNTIYQA